MVAVATSTYDLDAIDCISMAYRSPWPGYENGGGQMEIASALPAPARVCARCGQARRIAARGLCTTCYDLRRWHPCIDCGVLVTRTATRCRTCMGVARTDKPRGAKLIAVVDHAPPEPQIAPDVTLEQVLEVASAALAGCIFCGRQTPLTRGACNKCYIRARRDPQMQERLLPPKKAGFGAALAARHAPVSHLPPRPPIGQSNTILMCIDCRARAANPTVGNGTRCLRCDGVRRLRQLEIAEGRATA